MHFPSKVRNSLLNCTQLAKRWGVSRATVSRVLSRLEELQYIELITFSGNAGSVIYLKNYRETMFQMPHSSIDKMKASETFRLRISDEYDYQNQLLREKIMEYEKKEGLIYSDTSFSDYIRFWLDMTSRKVDAITMQGYQILANTHILPYFDDLEIPLADVNWRILQAYIDEKARSGRVDGKGGLSPRSLRLHKNILNQTLNLAVKNNFILQNPCQFVVLPQATPHESQYYSVEQLKTLFEALKDEPMLPLIKITAIYGLRRSELLGLQWKSIDLNAKTMTIRHTMAKVNEIVAKDKTKNSSSHRIFPLTSETVTIFKQLKAQESANRKAFGKQYTENDYVFKWPDGKPYSPDYVTHKFSKLLRHYDFPHNRFHELRHSCASVLLSMGWSLKDIQEWLGHSDIKMTANIYSHLDTTRKFSIAQSLSGTFE